MTLIPMLATAVDRLPADRKSYAYEFKWDGYRALCFIENGRVTLKSRRGNDLTAYFPELLELHRAVGHHRAVLDGEIVALGADGRIDFHSLQMRMGLEEHAADFTPRPAKYLIFDILRWDDQVAMYWPYEKRRALLESVIQPGRRWEISLRSNDPERMLDAAKKNGLEGIVAKRLSSRYAPGKRTGDWLKLKLTQTEDFVIGGWLPGKGFLQGRFGSVLVGYYASPEAAKQGRLTFAGAVGTGFTDAFRHKFGALLGQQASSDNPFIELPREARFRAAQFVKPALVCEVQFSEWTPFRIVRAPSFKAIRFDKAPETVILSPSGRTTQRNPGLFQCSSAGCRYRFPHTHVHDSTAHQDFLIAVSPQELGDTLRRHQQDWNPEDFRRWQLEKRREAERLLGEENQAA
jgi:bifunctional non-homologous end joining protein LigD